MKNLLLIAVLAMLTSFGSAVAKTEQAAVSKEVTLTQSRALKENVAKLNADLIDLEREILYPTKTQLGVFVAMDEGAFFALKSVEIFVNELSMTKYDYSDKEVYAIQKGGKHRIYMGNYQAGKYNIKAVIKGVGPHGRPYRRSAVIDVEKSSQKNLNLELNVVDGSNKYRPDFDIIEWD